MFSSADEVVIFADGESKLRLIQVLEKKRLSVLVAEEHVLTEELPYFDRMDPVRSTYIIGQSELRELMKKQNGYYISGMIAVLDSGFFSTALQSAYTLSGIAGVTILPVNILFYPPAQAYRKEVTGRSFR